MANCFIHDEKDISTLPIQYTIDEFEQNVLANRNNYKGIFIQWSTIAWNTTLFQRPQHISTNMAKLNYLVIYYTCYTNDNLSKPFKQISTNLWLCNNINYITMIPNTYISIYSTYHRNIFDICINNTSKIIYEYIDHIDPKISWDKCDKLTEIKNQVFSKPEIILISTADILYNETEAIPIHHKIGLIQNGVEVDHFKKDLYKDYILPKDYLSFIGSYSIIVGYYGAIAPWLDYDLISSLINQRLDVGFVFIGPDYLGSKCKLTNAKNMFYIPGVDYKYLPAYAYKFDICFIPFHEGTIAETTSPLKLFEYFALGKPVITTSFMLECIKFPVVLHGRNADEISVLIDLSMKRKDDKSYLAKLESLAISNSWIERCRRYSDIINPST